MSEINFKCNLIPLFLKTNILSDELYDYKIETENKMKKENNELDKENNKIKERFIEFKRKIKNEKKQILFNLNKTKRLIEISKYKNELKELQESNKLEEKKIIHKKDIDLIDLENLIEIENFNKETEFLIKQKIILNEINLAKLESKLLFGDEIEDKIKEYNELIEKTKKQNEEVIKENIQCVFDLKREYEEKKNNFAQKIQNAKEKYNLEIRIKQLQFENFKLSKFNEGLLYKKKIFEDFIIKYNENNLCIQKLKKTKIDKTKNYTTKQ